LPLDQKKSKRAIGTGRIALAGRASPRLNRHLRSNKIAHAVLVLVRGLHHLPANRYAEDEKDQAHHQKQEEQKLRDARRSGSDSSKSEERGHQRDYQKNKAQRNILISS